MLVDYGKVYDQSCYFNNIQMFNFGSMFNPLRNAPGSSLSQLLAIPNVSLMRLLDEECFTSQFRSSSSQVRQQSMNYKKFEDLIQLVTQVGDPFDKKRSFKFPLTAAELLSSELGFVFEKLIPDEGVVQQQEKIVTTTEREVQQEVEDDDEDGQDLQISSSDGSSEEKVQPPPKNEQPSNQEEEFGQFVQAPIKKKRIIKVKEVVQVVSISKKQYPPLLLKIFQYFEKEINYTLSSYCCRILTTLINKRSTNFFSKLFEKEEYSLNIIKHIQSRSVVEFIVRLLTYESKEFLDKRVNIFKKVLEALGFSQRIEVLSNISATLCETFQKLALHFKTPNPCKELQAYYTNIPEYLEITVNYLIGQDQSVALYSAPLIYHLLTSLPQELNESVDSSLNKFVTGAISKLRKSLESGNSLVGPGRVKIVEILNYLLKRENVRLQLSQQQNLIQLFSNLIKAHPLNNILHNQIFKIISEAIGSQTQAFTRKIISDEFFLKWLQDQAVDQQQRKDKKNKKVFKGYSAHLVNLCKLMKDSSNPIVKQIAEDLRFGNINSLITDKQFACRSRNLGGYSVLKNNKFQVMSSKQDILKHHAVFLSNARPAVFQIDLDDPLQNPTLLEELKRQLDGIEAQQTQDRPEEIVEEEKHKEQLIEENEQHRSAFWKLHIDYDIEQLMREML